MSKVTWLGDDDRVTFWGTAFEKGKAIEVTDPAILERLGRNRLFKVEAGGKTPPPPPPTAEQEDHPSASTRGAKGARPGTPFRRHSSED